MKKTFIYREVSDEVRRYRCLTAVGDYGTLNYSSWVYFTHKTQSAILDRDCEFVQVEFLNTSNTNVTSYIHLHTNIDPDATKFKAKNEGQYRPDVAIIVFDAVSMSNRLRSLQKTIKMMQQSYSVIL